jgi:hypothetical protein
MLRWRYVGWVKGEVEWLCLCIPVSSCGRRLDRIKLKREAKVRFLSPSPSPRLEFKSYMYILRLQAERASMGLCTAQALRTHL